MSNRDRRGRGLSRVLPFAVTVALALAVLIARGVPQGTPKLALMPAASIDPMPAVTNENLSKEIAATAAPLPMVKSWRGTEVAGDIHLDASGNVIPDEDLHELFDYLLSASNVLKPEQIRQHLLAVGHQHALGPVSLNQLDTLFTHYNDYRAAAANLQSDSADLEGMKRSFDARHQLRVEKLGSRMADGFFASSEAQDRYQLAVLEIDNDKSIGEDERQRRLEALKSQAPAEVVAARQPSETLQTLETRTETLRKAGADESQIESLRVQTVGPEAAARLQTLDEQNAAWNQRMQALRQTRSQIFADAGIAQTDKQRAIDDYIDKNFAGPEAIRARALLSLDQTAAN